MKKLFLLIGLICGLSLSALFAQMTDDEVATTALQMHVQGMGKQAIISEMLSRGVTEEQARRIYEKYVGSGGTTQVVGNSAPQTTTDESREREGFEAVTVVPAPIVVTPSSIYGHNIFSSAALTFEPILNIPTPSNYKLGPGDEVVIDIWGATDLSVRHVITTEGTIHVPEVGPVYLNGKTMKEAEVTIKTVYGRIYSDLLAKDPKTFIQATLGKIRSIKVNVIGEVTLPGTFTLPSLATMMHALYAAGGPTRIGTIRDILLYRNGRKIASLDVYQFILKGDTTGGDVILQDGDMITVGTASTIVNISGNVKRPMMYELRENENLDVLFYYAGGFSSDAYKEKVNIARKGETEYQFYTVDSRYFPTFRLEDGDAVTVGSILNRFENRVSIGGAVWRPGDFAISDKIATVTNLIEAADGLRGEEALTTRAILTREKEDRTQTVLSIDLAKLMAGEIADIELQRNDALFIPNINEIRDARIISVSGAVRIPQTIPYKENMSVEDVILQCGGLTERASTINLQIFRPLIDSKATAEPMELIQTLEVSLNDDYQITGNDTLKLQPFDAVVVRTSPVASVSEFVSIGGEVLFPGTYAKITKNERLSDLVNKAGGLTSLAYVKAASLTRRSTTIDRQLAESVAELTALEGTEGQVIDASSYGKNYSVAIDLEKALKNPGSEFDIVLMEGDRITIPLNNNTVKISGAVLYKNVVTFRNGMSYSDYIETAGGYVKRADKNRAYVLYPNGNIKRKKWLFTPEIEPGCEIIVPLKEERQNVMSTAEIVSISTAAASLVTVVVTLVNLLK